MLEVEPPYIIHRHWDRADLSGSVSWETHDPDPPMNGPPLAQTSYPPNRILTPRGRAMAPPKKSKKGEGFHSAAGLIRYFDAEEETAVKIDPKIVVGMCIAAGVIVEILRWKYTY